MGTKYGHQRRHVRTSKLGTTFEAGRLVDSLASYVQATSRAKVLAHELEFHKKSLSDSLKKVKEKIYWSSVQMQRKSLARAYKK